MKKENRNKLYMGLFIVFIMVSSTIGFIYSSDSSKKYKGYSFTLTESGWTTYIKNRNQYWSFNYLPNELNFDSDIGFISSKSYVVIDKDYFYEVSKKFALLSIIVDKIDLKDVNCSSEYTTLIFNETDYNKIYKEDKCIYFEGNKLQLIDKLFYHLLGVN